MEKYSKPETDVLEFATVDVMTTSGGTQLGGEVPGPGFGGQLPPGGGFD